MTEPLIYSRDAASYPSALLQQRNDWGLRVADLVNPPRRLWSDGKPPHPIVEQNVDFVGLRPVPPPLALIDRLPSDVDNWQAQSRRSLSRFHAYFLLAEDPQRRLDARKVETLAHQVSLVRHVLDNPNLQTVLLADEVGLGKSVEAGLILKELLEAKPGLRALYLAPARLVSNVRREFERLELDFRQWSATESDARLTDNRVIASIHKAVHGHNASLIRAAAPWDIIVVDECHHLSAWEPGAGDPTQAYKLVRDLILAQGAGGRVILLSGTPHQGNVTRFENLLLLLRKAQEAETALAGRVIYRTKDDVRDWEGRPLFPTRRVNAPIVVDLGPDHRNWITKIHRYFQPPKSPGENDQARRRAAGWRCVQALQWAASSPSAGLGYLTRQAIRAGATLADTDFKKAIGALRPYRLGAADESLEILYERIRREIGDQEVEQDIADIEDDTVPARASMSDELRDLLRDGVDLVRNHGDEKWDVIRRRVLDEAGDEKVALFAQPVETVTSLARYLERMTGRAPAMIVGGQSEGDRQKQIDAFRSPTGPRFLVSSRAGGEGINLQVARRIVHVDVPWNPMDMEQRVGRVHRFGSRQTIIVDTLVVKDSREEAAYRIARSKLETIAATLVEAEKFDALYARVMCLVPPEELLDVVIGRPTAPFSEGEQEKIATMVQQGFQLWRNFHERFGREQATIQDQDAGLAEWRDVADFLVEQALAEPVTGHYMTRFRLDGETVAPVDESALAFKLADGRVYACGDYGGSPVSGPSGSPVGRVGLNVQPVADALKMSAFPTLACGAAHVRWKGENPRPAVMANLPAGILIYLRQTVKTDNTSAYSEHATKLRMYVVRAGGECIAIDGNDARMVARGLRTAVIRREPEFLGVLIDGMRAADGRLTTELRRPTDDELRRGVRHAVTPLLACIVTE